MQEKEDYNVDCNSFFMGPTGIFTMGCILYSIKNDICAFNDSLKEILSLQLLSTNPNQGDELLYGTAGYLYALLLIKTQCIIPFDTSDLDKAIISISTILINNGLIGMNTHKDKVNNKCLVFPFPKGKKHYSLYLGGAHGVIGVLYELLCAIKLFKDKFTQVQIDIIKSSLDFVSTLKFETGNFPSSVTGGSDTKVHFCHGPIGAIHLYGLASEIFSDINYLKITEKCSISIWERGLLLKGNCVCHGISGSVYGMYKLYQLTKKRLSS